MEAGMKISAIAPWFGGKRNLAPEIVAELGPHRVYWEPFCGSLAVLLIKEPCVMETANDLNGDLVNLARCLKDEESALELYARVNRFVMHEDLFKEAAVRHRAIGRIAAGEPDVDRAEDYLVCSWFGRNGVAGTSSYNAGFCVRYTANGGHAAKRWQSACESIPAWHARLKNVTILNRDAFEILGRIDDEPGTAIYCDPPYVEKGAKYIHDFEHQDHAKLAGALCRFKRARVVVSYYAHSILAGLYPRWTCRQIEVTRSMANQGGKEGAVKATEIMLINGPSLVMAGANELF